MTKRDTKQNLPSKRETPKETPTFGDFVADSEPAQLAVELGDKTMLVRELTGRERFEAGEKADELNTWDLMLWMCNLGIVSPRPRDLAELEKIKPVWIKKLADAIMKISGMRLQDVEDAEKELAAVIDIGGS